MFRAAIALSNVSLLLVSGCGGSGSSNSLPASTTAAPLSGGQPCEHGMTSNGSCVFAQHVYNAFGGAWAAHGTPPKSLTVTMNPVDCSAQPHGTWLCRSRRSAVWVEFQLEQAPTKTTPVATPPPTTTDGRAGVATGRTGAAGRSLDPPNVHQPQLQQHRGPTPRVASNRHADPLLAHVQPRRADGA
jgi:hypothetical protein